MLRNEKRNLSEEDAKVTIGTDKGNQTDKQCKIEEVKEESEHRHRFYLILPMES